MFVAANNLSIADIPAFHDRSSFFDLSPMSTELFLPIDPTIHKPITVSQFLRKKLRWLTLGGQYDWTKKKYPSDLPPTFPNDIASLVHDFFPDTRPEAAIVNLYTPGDTLSVHRDVSEESDRGLVSISLGCDAIFIVGIDNQGDSPSKHLVVRLRSGDAVYMTGSARFAWHGIPQIIADTCPQWLSDWPAGCCIEHLEHDTTNAIDKYEAWRGWMSTKRVNLNIRQMKN